MNSVAISLALRTDKLYNGKCDWWFESWNIFNSQLTKNKLKLQNEQCFRHNEMSQCQTAMAMGSAHSHDSQMNHCHANVTNNQATNHYTSQTLTLLSITLTKIWMIEPTIELTIDLNKLWTTCSWVLANLSPNHKCMKFHFEMNWTKVWHWETTMKLCNYYYYGNTVQAN
jgi:hypothetical protein